MLYNIQFRSVFMLGKYLNVLALASLKKSKVGAYVYMCD